MLWLPCAPRGLLCAALPGCFAPPGRFCAPPSVLALRLRGAFTRRLPCLLCASGALLRAAFPRHSSLVPRFSLLSPGGAAPLRRLSPGGAAPLWRSGAVEGAAVGGALGAPP